MRGGLKTENNASAFDFRHGLKRIVHDAYEIKKDYKLLSKEETATLANYNESKRQRLLEVSSDVDVTQPGIEH